MKKSEQGASGTAGLRILVPTVDEAGEEEMVGSMVILKQRSSEVRICGWLRRWWFGLRGRRRRGKAQPKQKVRSHPSLSRSS